MAGVLDKAAILSADDRPAVEFDVPEWGGVVRLKPWSVADQMAFEDVAADTGEGSRTAFAYAVMLSVVDADGARVFGKKDVPALMDKGAGPLVRVFRKISDINRLGEDALKAVEGN